MANGRLRVSIRPPPAAAPAWRNLRLERSFAEKDRLESAGVESEAIKDHSQPSRPVDCAASLIASLIFKQVTIESQAEYCGIEPGPVRGEMEL